MSENRLIDIVKGARASGQGAFSALGTGLKERLKEKIDPRRMFNQKGLMTALFPSLKAYKSGVSEPSSLAPVSQSPKSLDMAVKDTEILAKNMLVLPAIHKDFNLMRQNLAKMVKLRGGTPVTRVDKDFFKSRERTAAYGQQTNPTPTPEPASTGNNNSFDILKMVALVGLLSAGIKIGLEYVGDKIKDSIVDTLKGFPTKVADEIKSLFTRPSKDDIVDFSSGIVDYMTDEGYKKLVSPEMYKKLAEAAENQGQESEDEGAATTAPTPVPSYVPTKTPEQVGKLSVPRSQMQDMVYKAWTKAGFSNKQSAALTAEVGRENGYNASTIFGEHKEQANNSTHGRANIGMLSWAAERRDLLLNYMRERGLTYKTKQNGKEVELFDPSQASLDAMAAFAKMEMETNPQYKRTKEQFVANPDIGRDEAAEILGNDYIKWRYKDPKYEAHHERRNTYYAQIEAKEKKEPGLLQRTARDDIAKVPQSVVKVDKPPKITGAAADSLSTSVNQAKQELDNNNVMILTDPNSNMGPPRRPGPFKDNVPNKPKNTYQLLIQNATQH